MIIIIDTEIMGYRSRWKKGEIFSKEIKKAQKLLNDLEKDTPEEVEVTKIPLNS